MNFWRQEVGFARWLRWLAAMALVLAWLPARVRAQAGSGPNMEARGADAASPRYRPIPNQGWFVVPIAEPAKTGTGEPAVQTVLLFHVPPRTGANGVPDGTLRRAGELVRTPALWCVRGPGLYMLFDEGPPPKAFPGPPKPRQMLTIRSVRDEHEEWATDPAGRPDVLPSLDGAGALLGMAGSDVGIFVLRRVDGSLRLDELDPDEAAEAPKWTQVLGLAPQLEGAKGRVALAGFSRGVLIADSSGTLWTVKCDSNKPTWTARALGELGVKAVLAPDGVLTVCAGQLLASWTEADGTLRVASRPMDDASGDSGGPGWRELASVPGVGSQFDPSAMDADERIAYFYARPAAAKPGQPKEDEPRLLELGVRTGRVLYNGGIKLAPPISSADYVLLGMVMWIVLGMVTAGIVPPKEGVVVIPDGTSIAEPMRRIIAGLIDFSLAMLAVSRIEGVPVSDLLTMPWWSSEAGQLVVIQALGSLVVVCTVLECLLGRSPGKLVTGCEVIGTALRLDSGKKLTQSHPSLLRALLRNFLKWGLPPLGMLGVMDPSGRGRHDQYARTAVIVRYVPEDEPLDDDFDE